MPKETTKKSRLEVLDHLRGFFIVVIIIDHLSRFPSLWGLFTGKALLWVTAAEGFVAISGLLVGYVRGYKNRELPLKDVSKKLLSRAFLLYVWSLIGSIVYTAIIWYVPLQGGSPGLPVPKGDWNELIFQLVTMQYTYVWVHFLTLYAIFLAAAPIAIWLLRQGKAWIVGLLSLVVLTFGWLLDSEAMQWQFLFFIPSIVGYYLSSILTWWANLSTKVQRRIAGSTVALTLATITVSVIFTFYSSSFSLMAQSINTGLFDKDTVSLWRAGLAFLWFTGFVFIFKFFHAFIAKRLGWLLIPIGTSSLTAYILHGLALCIISFFTIASENIVINTLLGVVAVMIVWSLLKIPFVRKVIPS